MPASQLLHSFASQSVLDQGAHPYLCQTGQIHQGKVEHVGRVDLEVDGLAGDSLVVTGHARGLILDLALDIAKVGETTVGDVVELGPLAWSRNVWVPL